MGIVDRVKAILVTPRTEWSVIEGEQTDIQRIYREYLVILAAIPAVATFIGLSVFGMGGMGFSFRVPIGTGLANAIVSYIGSLVMVWLMSLVVNALAPTFGGTKNPLAAFKTMAYGGTAAMVAGIFYLVPSLSMLAFLGSLYTVYLVYLGLPVLMKCPQDKAIAYTAVVMVVGFVMGMVMGMLMAVGSHGPGMMGAGDGGSVTVSTPKGEVTIDTAKMEAAAKKMEEAGKVAEQAAKAGDTAAAGKAVAEAMAVLQGAAGGREPLPSQALKAMLPDSVGGLPRESFEASDGNAVGIKASQAKAVYRDGERRIELEVTDTGGLAGLASLAGWVNVTGEKESPDGRERVWKEGGRTYREQVRKGDGGAEFSAVLASGVVIEARGSRGVEAAAVRQAVEALDLKALEAERRKG